MLIHCWAVAGSDPQNGSAAIVEAEELRRRYGEGEAAVDALAGVTVAFPSGRFAAIMGPSGSGKSTLMHLLAGLDRPTSGAVTLGGVELTGLDDRRLTDLRRDRVGFIFQAFHLMPHTSALDNATIKLTGSGCTLREGRRRALPWLERVGLGARAEHTPEQLSMGERQRIAIARALANEPRLLLADEPTGNLDSRRSREIIALLRDICHERDIPALLVTHDLDAIHFVDRVHTLRDGHLADGMDPELAAASS